MKTRVVAALLALLLVAVAWVWWWRDGETAAAAPARVAVVVPYTVDWRELVYRSEALGTLRAVESVAISANVTETVAALHFNDGDRVTRGAVLATLAQDEERAQLAEAQAHLAEQERELTRLEGLVKARAIPQSELDQRRTQRDRARHQIAAIEARLADRTVRAPFSGHLGLRAVSVGALVTPGTVITTLDDLSRLYLDFNLPETLLGGLLPGQRVEARSAAFDGVFEGRVTAIDSRVNPVDRSVVVRAVFENPAFRLRPGLLMTVSLLREPERVLAVPEESLVSMQERHFVWVIRDDGTVVQRAVVLAGREPGWVAVASGLEAGERVVHEGLMGLRNGLPVRLRDDSAAEH